MVVRVLSASNLSAQSFCCGATRYVLAQQGTASAEPILAFDFSGSSFQPNAVEITDRLTLFTNTAVERVEAQVQYSQNGTSFLTQRIVQTPNDGGLVDVVAHGRAWHRDNLLLRALLQRARAGTGGAAAFPAAAGLAGPEA